MDGPPLKGNALDLKLLEWLADNFSQPHVGGDSVTEKIYEINVQKIMFKV
jgi:hypothetical protein